MENKTKLRAVDMRIDPPRQTIALWIAAEERPCLERKSILVEPKAMANVDGVTGSGESSGITDKRILRLFAENPEWIVPEVAEFLKMSARGVEKRIAILKKEERLIHTGSTKKGRWQVTAI